MLVYVLINALPTNRHEHHVTQFLSIFLQTSLGLVLFAGLISGLTLGLLSMDLLHLEVLQKGGDEDVKLYASRIIPLAKRHHLLLVSVLSQSCSSDPMNT
jgi:metal transporter CNNM